MADKASFSLINAFDLYDLGGFLSLGGIKELYGENLSDVSLMFKRI